VSAQRTSALKTSEFAKRFGTAEELAEKSQFAVTPSEARDLLFAKCQGKKRLLTPQTPFGMTKQEFSAACAWRA
jgi:hypothetical protein